MRALATINPKSPIYSDTAIPLLVDFPGRAKTEKENRRPYTLIIAGKATKMP
jgi:hypothetical protein